MAGYSGTPLAKKLGIRPHDKVCATGAPDNYRELLEPLPEAVTFTKTPGTATNLAHLFVTRAAELARSLPRLRARLAPSAIVWVSWPKQASKRPTDVTEDTVRRLALPLGFVDVKVCAVDEVWSGLKLVVRKELR
jgi:hypothetical protein